jgi:hypothetical protein
MFLTLVLLLEADIDPVVLLVVDMLKAIRSRQCESVYLGYYTVSS